MPIQQGSEQLGPSLKYSWALEEASAAGRVEKGVSVSVRVGLKLKVFVGDTVNAGVRLTVGELVGGLDPVGVVAEGLEIHPIRTTRANRIPE